MAIKTDLTRRSFIKSAAAGAGAAAVPVALTGCGGDDNDSDSSKPLGVHTFSHGVASGDPLTDSVIIWTRVTPENEESSDSIDISWQVSDQADMSNIVKDGVVTTDKTKDFTVKTDVTGLTAGTTYYYRFSGPGGTETTDIGQTKTLPEGAVQSIKFAVCSCANYPFGFFNVYEQMSQSDADIVLHLGDYIYEYRAGQYPTTPADGRAPDPAKEVVTLADYRERYAQYRADVQLQAVHQVKPFICVWDDHELANDAYRSGAQNHNEGEGDFEERRQQAFQAYHEWMPIRSGTDLSNIYRQFEIGNLVNLQMLDTRHTGRDKPLSVSDFPGLASTDPATAAAEATAFANAIGSSNRTLLGDSQRDLAITNMVNSNATWQVFGQQVLIGRILAPAELLQGINTLQTLLEDNRADEAEAAQTEVTNLISQLYALKLQQNAHAAGAPGVPALTAAETARLATALPYNLDAWDGYAYEREVIFNNVALHNKNLVVLAGDTHNAWANELRLLQPNSSQTSDVRVGVEFATAAVTSPGFDEYLSLEGAAKVGFESAIAALVDDLAFMDASRRGFMEVEFTPAKATCEWIFVNTITTKEGVVTNNQYTQLAADGVTPVTRLAKFEVEPDGITTTDKLVQVNPAP